jgi:hypothetical protein
VVKLRIEAVFKEIDVSETMRMWVEVSFDVVYLIVVWCLVIAMLRRRSIVKPEDRRVAWLVLNAFMLLALGDTAHVGLRVLAYAAGDMAMQVAFLGTQFGVLGLGELATAITVTLFYVLMLAIWRSRFDREYGPFEHFLLACAIVRLLLIALPANQWDNLVPPQPWATIRNLPLLLQGLGVAYLFLRDGRASKDRAFTWMAAMILVSFACYMAVILLYQQMPLIGMLMIPKTVAYVVACLLVYNQLYRVRTIPIRT